MLVRRATTSDTSIGITSPHGYGAALGTRFDRRAVKRFYLLPCCLMLGRSFFRRRVWELDVSNVPSCENAQDLNELCELACMLMCLAGAN